MLITNRFVKRLMYVMICLTYNLQPEKIQKVFCQMGNLSCFLL